MGRKGFGFFVVPPSFRIFYGCMQIKVAALVEELRSIDR